MNKLFKRLLCGVVTASMVIGTLVLPAMADGDPVISVTFDDGDDAYTLQGATIEENSYGNSVHTADGKYATINNASAIQTLSGDFTISVAVKPVSLDTWARAIDIGSGTNDYMFICVSPLGNDGHPRFAIKANGGSEQSTDAADTISIDEWSTITVVRTDATTKIYINGKLSKSSTDITYTPSQLTGTSNSYIGKSQFPDPDFKGCVDDIAVYDRALSDEEITELAAKTTAYNTVDAVAKRKQLIYDNNRFIADTHFSRDGSEIFAMSGIPSGMYVTDKSLTDNTASFTLHDYENGLDNLTAFVAEYSDNSLVKLTAPQIDKENFTGSVSIPFTKENETDTVKLFVWDDMEPMAETKPEDITATVSVKNYTTNSGSVTAQVYAVGGTATQGAETPITDATATANYNSLDEKDLSIDIPLAKIPSDTSKLIVKLTTQKSDSTEETGTAATLYKLASAPVAAPADSEATTSGAHDPSIVKFPNDDTYYVYSSHHLIFTSEDLINWKKYDFTNLTTNPEFYDKDTDSYPNRGKTQILTKTFDFVHDNINANVNGTYWAPDVIYREDDEKPYWMYISLSCGLGGRNSAIGLIKSPTPLFWADPDTTKVAAIEDCGVVFATKDTSEYKTNAIDANIYYDSTDNNKPYFVWGSFWGGIQAAPLTSDGKVQGIDYTSDTTILNTCKNFGTSVFTQKRGVAGPEGAWMIEHGNYRYAFTSYAWLGSNYNTRIARAPLSKAFGTDTGTQLLDANNVIMGREYSRSTGTVKKDEITGYKLIGSYRLGDGTMTIAENDANDWYYPREAGDAHIYYGPGHNSVINIGDESFYVSHVRKDAPEGGAILQTRKILWTADGWPVVSPVTYAGEKEQKMPKSMILGTYDLASVGVTKLAGSDTTINENWTNHSGNRNYDLPILSSKVTLGSDMNITNKDGSKIGTWEFDGDHTVTLKFTANGDESKDEFYKSGDTMTMFALYGYDKDEAEPVVALTGTDQKHITQLAKKSAANIYKTIPEAIGETTPTVLTKSAGGNPELGFDSNGNILYAGDPAALVDGDTVYLYVGHDESSNDAYVMRDWLCYSSKNMTDWTYEGPIMSASSISWASNSTSAWASQVAKHNDKYYLYFCTWNKNDSGKMAIGVAESNSPKGPFTNPRVLIKGSDTYPETHSWDDIDPTILIENEGTDDQHIYLAWGNVRYYVCELNDDMVSVKDLNGDNEITMHVDIKERKIKSMGSNGYTEAPWLYKRDGKYYLFFASNVHEEMAYAMMDDGPLGRYDYKQTIMPPTATSDTNHPAVIDFGGKTYFIYHNGALTNGSGHRRSVCIEELEFDENGYIYPLTETSIGLNGTASTIKTSEGKYLGHDAFRNPLADSSYPLSIPITVSSAESEYNTAWEIKPAKAAPQGEDEANYVSIQSVDKPGLYISVSGGKVTLTQDADGLQGSNMTFKTIKGLDGKSGSVSFESVSEPGKYLTALNKSLTLSYGSVPADASFTIGEVTAKPSSVISVAEKEVDAQPEADITQNFNTTAATLISLGTTDVPAYTALSGVTLYMGARKDGGDGNQKFAIQSDGVTGNALVLSAGSYQSASRGGRMAIYTPAIPEGYTVTAEFKTKLVNGSGGAAKLYYNDSTGSVDTNGTLNSDVSDTKLTADNNWHTVTMTITNTDDVYTRVISIDGKPNTTDYVDSFPVFWGTIENKTGSAVYFDDLTIKTTTKSGETPTITLPDPAAKFTFDGNLTDEIGNGSGTLTGPNITDTTTAAEATYVDGASSTAGDKAISFSGAGSYGVELPVKPSGSNYTISFDVNINAITASTPMVFLANYDGTTLKGGDENAQWISVMSQGWWTTDIADAPIIWSRNVTGGESWYTAISAGNGSIALNSWRNITIAVSGTTANVYVNKSKIYTGDIAAIIDSTTKVYLGTNAFDADTPFNGAIDNFILFNETLSASQIALIGKE